MQPQLARTKLVHEEDFFSDYREVYLPYAFARKDPHAGTSWEWQYVFPASKRSLDPRSGRERRHHTSETVLQKASSTRYARQVSLSVAVAIRSGIALLHTC